MLLPSVFLAAIAAAVVRGNVEGRDSQVEGRAGDSDVDLSTLDLVRKYDFVGENHDVITPDGYILEVHRITGPRADPKPDGKPVVLVMHGLLSSSADWVVPGPEKGLAYVLAKQGYDVWLGNVRGNYYSRRHILPSIKKEKYWTFSWHEIGVIDLPTMVDYILKETGSEKIFYVGHSQGTTAFWVMCSQLPAYQAKIKAMFALAPVAYVKRIPSPVFQLLARVSDHIAALMKLIGMYEFKPTPEAIKKFTSLVCKESAVTQPFCTNVIFMIAGYNNEQLNKTLLPTILGHVPAGSSVKQFQHYAQLIKSGYFRQYDHGLIGNLNNYGSLRPPKYNLNSIRVPVALLYSANDWLAHVKDVDQLYRELGNPIGKIRVPLDKFNHLDFLWAIDVKELVYDKIISLMTRFKS